MPIDLPPLWTGLFLGFASTAAVFGLLLIGAYEAGRDAERRAWAERPQRRAHMKPRSGLTGSTYPPQAA